jgi:hypothetical protein
MVPAVFAVGALGAGVASGSVPVTFAVSGAEFNLTADHLHGTDFTQYGNVVSVKALASHGLPSGQAVAESTIGSASITNLCQSVGQNVNISALGFSHKVWLKLTAGKDPNNPAVAKNLLIDMTHLSGDATFTNIDIGQDASDLSSHGTLGGFGQAADIVDIDHLSQTAWATTAGTFTLPGLDLGLQLDGTDPC